jgi:hypothetical protein
MILLNESSGSCSNNLGHVSQHDPQLTQVARSIITFTGIHLDYWFNGSVCYKYTFFTFGFLLVLHANKYFRKVVEF